MMSKDSNFRVVKKQTNFFGIQYEIQQRLPFFKYWSRWKGTHLFNTKEQAILITEHLKKRNEGLGEIVYVS